MKTLKMIPRVEEDIFRLFGEYEFVDGFPLLLGKLHKDVHQEFIEEARRLEKQIFHPQLGTLKYHLNVGQNLGQASIPKHRLNDGFALHYITALGAYFLHRLGYCSFQEGWSMGRLLMSNHPSHMESSWWLNWADKSSINERHNHPTSLTSVLYVENTHLAKTNFYMDGMVYQHTPEDGQIVLFPGWLEHSVEPINEDGVRITAACNLNYYAPYTNYLENITQYETIY